MARMVRHVYASPNEYIKVHRGSGGAWLLWFILFCALFRYAIYLCIAIVAFYVLKFIIKIIWRLIG